MYQYILGDMYGKFTLGYFGIHLYYTSHSKFDWLTSHLPLRVRTSTHKTYLLTYDFWKKELVYSLYVHNINQSSRLNDKVILLLHNDLSKNKQFTDHCILELSHFWGKKPNTHFSLRLRMAIWSVAMAMLLAALE